MLHVEPSPNPVRFGTFDLDLKSGELRKRGMKVRLHDKPFQVLAALLERPGEVVSRRELQRRLWSEDTFVDFDNNLNAAVKKLRSALGDSALSPRFIETLPRKGYRFIAPLTTDGAASPAAGTTRIPRAWLGVAALLAAVAAAASYLAIRQPPPGPSSEHEKIKLAVMPFENLDGDLEREYISDGLTEEMITQLGRLEPARLGVIARISSMTYKGTQKTVDEIGRELDVQYLLEGSVRGGAGERLRITAQLIAVADQTHLWAETYDRDFGDVLAVQSEIARRIARSLAPELLPHNPRARARAATSVTEAYQEYLRGRHQWNRFTSEGYQRAIAHFERAIVLDAGFAQAYAGLADAYNLLAFTTEATPHEAFPAARDAASEALELDPELAEAHNSLAFVRLYFDWDLAAAEQGFRRALELSPNDAMAYHWYAGALAALERHDEAVAAIRRGVELDPLALSVRADLGWYYNFADRYDEAIVECERTLEIDPDYGWAIAGLQEAYARQGRYREAVDAVRRLLVQAGATDEELGPLADPDPQAALRHGLEMQLQKLRGWQQQGKVSARSVAIGHALLGERDDAFRWLERAYEERDGWLIFLKVDPRLDHLHGDPRFESLAARVGLP